MGRVGGPAGLLLAAGAGRRMGGPKALLDGLLVRSVRTLLDGGCAEVTVVLGASAERARVLLADVARPVDIVVAADWRQGMGASLRAGLGALGAGAADRVLVTLVDLPDVDARVVGRVAAAAQGPTALVRATYGGRPGHPVLLGRAHWAGVRAVAHGDRGARDYLLAHPAAACECGDLATGRDVDRPADLAP